MLPPMPELSYKATTGAALVRTAELWGDDDFVVMPDRRMTYREAEVASRALGKRMLAAGIGKGTRFGMFDTYSTDWVVVWLAATRIGALVMPFSSIYKPAELGTTLQIGDVHTLWAPASFLGKDVPSFLEDAVPGLADAKGSPLFLESMPFLRSIWITGETDRAWATSMDVGVDDTDDGGVSEAHFQKVEEEVVPADLAQVTYTSGSSALPKGVIHTHGGIIRTTGAMAAYAREPGEPARVILNGFPFFWIGGTLVIGMAIQTGMKMCVLAKFEAGPALEMVEREKAQGVLAWPSLVQSMRAHPTFAERDLSSAPILTAGGNDATIAAGPVPGIPYHRGMSETVGNWSGADRKIVDPEAGTGEPLPDLAEGELWIRGWGVMQGYYKKEREEVFDDDGWFHTGDRCFIHENRAFFVGRFYEMIKSQGANVSPREVEMMLETIPEIKHALVFGVPHPVLEEEVTAVIVFKLGQSLTVEEIQAKAREQVSSYKVPSRIEFLEDEAEIPWLGSGKPDKLTLAARFTDEAGR